MTGRGSSQPPERRDPRSPSMAGILWRAHAVVGPDGQLLAIPHDVEVSVRFEGGRVAGSGGCNRISAEYRLDGDRLSLGPVAATMMACPEPAASIEATVLQALALIATWAVEEGSLVLRDADGLDRLVLDRVVEPTLVGPSWQATGVNNGRGGVASLVAGTAIDATFGEDGRVSGRAGCNRYHGPFRVDGPRLGIGPLASTRMACPDEAVMEQEAAFLAAMGRATTFRIDGDRLELRDDDGALQVSFGAGSWPGHMGT
jgi:heat shock protein HslJ